MKNLTIFSILFLILLIGGCDEKVKTPTPIVPNPKTPAPTPPDPDKLFGVTWQLVQIKIHGGATKPLKKNPITIAFEKKENDEIGVSGSAGCNRYFSSCETEEDQLTFGAIGSTKMLCSQEIMQIENSFLQALKKVDRYRVSTQLFLFQEVDAIELKFEKSENE